ncbi:MAG TPA: cation transporter, partial [Firmicutes bacterium]|nr:cation transporter [Bacillota bacterium]
MHDHGHNSGHQHSHGAGHAHSHALSMAMGLDPVVLNRLWWAFGINLVWLIVEVVGGLITGSLALLADAGHMLTDVAALGLAIFVAYLARTPRTPRRTFGLLRAEVIGAFLNGATLVVIVGLIFWEAWRRLGQPQEVDARLMLVIAVLGLAANAGSAWVLMSHQHSSVNVRGAFLHLVGDALGSVGAIVAGAVIWSTGWTPIDPIASVVIGLIILWGSIGLLRNTTNILLNAVPPGIDYEEVLAALTSYDHCMEVHDLHIWSITESEPALSAHVVLVPECSDTHHWQHCQEELQAMLAER